jgi:hypothetical protein
MSDIESRRFDFSPKKEIYFKRDNVGPLFHGFRRFAHGGTLELGFPTV